MPPVIFSPYFATKMIIQFNAIPKVLKSIKMTKIDNRTAIDSDMNPNLLRSNGIIHDIHFACHTHTTKLNVHFP